MYVDPAADDDQQRHAHHHPNPRLTAVHYGMCNETKLRTDEDGIDQHRHQPDEKNQHRAAGVRRNFTTNPERRHRSAIMQYVLFLKRSQHR